MSGIMSFINGFFSTIQTLLGWVLDGLMYVLKTILYFPFDGVLTAVESIIAALDFSSFATSTAASWTGMPPQLLYLVNAIGIPQGLAILASAYILRITLNLIPASLTRI